MLSSTFYCCKTPEYIKLSLLLNDSKFAAFDHIVVITCEQLITAGKKKDMMSMFQSKTALEKQADKLNAKQEELNIKSTGLIPKFIHY